MRAKVRKQIYSAPDPSTSPFDGDLRAAGGEDLGVAPRISHADSRGPGNWWRMPWLNFLGLGVLAIALGSAYVLLGQHGDQAGGPQPTTERTPSPLAIVGRG